MPKPGEVALRQAPPVAAKAERQVEDPYRLRVFSELARSLDWSPASRRGSLRRLFDGLTALCQAEIEYYYAARRRSNRWSQILRISAVVAATLGVAAPLVPIGQIGAWGYVLLAVAGGLITANQLTTATANHHRYVSAQLQLEHLLASYQVKWSRVAAGATDEIGEDEMEKGFSMLADFTSEMHRVIQGETSEWGEHTLRELERFAAETRARAS